MKDDPYNDIKKIHLAKLISKNGDISPLCALEPKRLDIGKERWTTDPKAVTCKKCKAKLKRYTTRNPVELQRV